MYVYRYVYVYVCVYVGPAACPHLLPPDSKIGAAQIFGTRFALEKIDHPGFGPELVLAPSFYTKIKHQYLSIVRRKPESLLSLSLPVTSNY